jgi:RimJ/RimL family protein N-acetyltransferase
MATILGFRPLSKSDFPLLLKWLETPHVKAWWDQEVHWRLELVYKKYGDYVEGYKLENGVKKSIRAYIISVDSVPVGYIQIYNAYDFRRSKPLKGLPKNLGAFDIFIGEESSLRQGFASLAIKILFENFIDAWGYIFSDPDSKNIAAIRAYEKAGFKKIAEYPDTGETWMLKNMTNNNFEFLRQEPKCIFDFSLGKFDSINFIRTLRNKFNEIKCHFLKIIFKLKTIAIELKKRCYNVYIFLVKNNWHLSKKRNFYNPTLAATVYQCGSEWNIARHNVHYSGFESKAEAMSTAFQMWLQEKEDYENT